MISSKKREDNIQRNLVTKNVILPQVSDPAQPQPIQIQVEAPLFKSILLSEMDIHHMMMLKVERNTRNVGLNWVSKIKIILAQKSNSKHEQEK